MRDAAAAILALALFAGCSEFPCADDVRVGTLKSIPFDYAQKARFTYWFEDGAQRSVFHRDEVPETARPAVLVQLQRGTSAELPGSMTWWADLSSHDGSRARLSPTANVRSRAHAAWVGAWTADWLHVNAQVTVVRQELREEILDDPPPRFRDQPPPPIEPPDVLREELENEGIAWDEVKLQRALRVVASREPLPRDFGLSFEVHPVWLFTTEGCDACDAASTWLTKRDVAHHELVLSDPTNASSLRALAAVVGQEAAAPALWVGEHVVFGFDDATYRDTTGASR